MEVVARTLNIPFSQDHHQRCSMKEHPGDNDPSCKFYDNNSFVCFGCRKGGSNIDLVAGVLGIPIGAALVWIERKVLRTGPVLLQSSALSNTLKASQARLAAMANPHSLFSPQAFRSELMSFANTEAAEIRGCLRPAVRDSLDAQIDDAYQLVDEIGPDFSRDDCFAARESLRAKLAELREWAESINELADENEQAGTQQPEGDLEAG